MEINLSFLCQAANQMPGGMINVLGLFNKIQHFQMPVQINMVLVLRLTASPGEKGTTQHIKVVVIDNDGVVIAPPIAMPLPIPVNLPGPDVEVHSIIGLNGVQFKQFGLYRVDITVNDVSKAQLPFALIAVPPPPGFADAPGSQEP
jgi:hypothetical protein